MTAHDKLLLTLVALTWVWYFAAAQQATPRQWRFVVWTVALVNLGAGLGKLWGF
jgi:hypothetical protein